MPPSGAPQILQRACTIMAKVEISEGGAESMIVTGGGRFGGYGPFLRKREFGVDRGMPVFHYNPLDLKQGYEQDARIHGRHGGGHLILCRRVGN
jgi:hypothetical protein